MEKACECLSHHLRSRTIVVGGQWKTKITIPKSHVVDRFLGEHCVYCQEPPHQKTKLPSYFLRGHSICSQVTVNS